MKKLLFLIKKLGSAFWIPFLFMTLFAVISNAFQITLVNFQRVVVNFVLKEESSRTFFISGIVLLFLTVLFFIIGYISQKKMTQYINQQRANIFYKFVNINLEERQLKEKFHLYKQYFPGFSQLIEQLIPSFLAICATVIMMSFTTLIWNSQIFLLVLVTAIIYACTIPLSKQLENYEKQDGENSEEILKKYQNIIENRHVFIFYPKSLYYLQKLSLLFQTTQTITKEKASVFAKIYLVGLATNMIRELGILFIAFNYFDLPVGDVLALFTITSFLNSSLAQSLNLYAEIQKSLVSIQKLEELYALQVEDNIRENLLFNQPMKAESLEFSWENQQLLFPNFQLCPGECVYLSGNNGVGKTTLLSLISGQSKPTSGTLNYSDQQLRNLTSIVFQDHFLFTASILENITCFEDAPNLEKVIELLDKVNLLQWVNIQEMGLQTIVSAETGLSGGQLQRICICRSFYKDSDILILDEPFSALDEENIQYVSDLFTATAKTIVYTSHTATVQIPNSRQIHLV